ncbi:MAG: tetratricopeptide repeat protein [Planctomycetota bacterium]
MRRITVTGLASAGWMLTGLFALVLAAEAEPPRGESSLSLRLETRPAETAPAAQVPAKIEAAGAISDIDSVRPDPAERVPASAHTPTVALGHEPGEPTPAAPRADFPVPASAIPTVPDSDSILPGNTATAIPTTIDTVGAPGHNAVDTGSKLTPSNTGADGDSSTPPAAVAQREDEERLAPIPDPLEAERIEIEAASFKGITPGVSTAVQLESAWGAPKEMQKRDGMLLQLYSVEPFDRVEVTCVDGNVASIVIRFERPFPADAVAQQLQLGNVRPVLVSNELGEVLGQVFPERGVLFAFEPGEAPGKPSMQVTQIILEPISAEPFILRGETNLETHARLSLLDLEQALKLEPKNGRALWLYSRLLAATGEYDKAIEASAQAVGVDPSNPHYHVTRAQLLGQVGRLKEAMTEAKLAAESSQDRPHVGARALCLTGDLCASGPSPDYQQAIHYHSEAVKAAAALVDNKHPAVRVAAKEVLVDAHLGAAHDIAWGDWKDKQPAVTRWLGQAATAAEDMIKTENASQDLRFRVCTRALAACVGLRGALDPTTWANEATRTGDRLVDASRDPVRKTQLQWDLGMALYDALQAYQMRGDNDAALQHGEKAIAYLENADRQRPSDTTSYLLGRLYFRLGAIHSLRDQNHHAALSWFDKALPLLQKPMPPEAIGDLGRHGETFVSMAVSYWEAGQREKAVELTAQGVEIMEQAVQQGVLTQDALAIPYGNLAAMHRQLGSADQATRYHRMATRLKTGQ